MDCRFEQDSFPSRLPDYLKMALNGPQWPNPSSLQNLYANQAATLISLTYPSIHLHKRPFIGHFLEDFLKQGT